MSKNTVGEPRINILLMNILLMNNIVNFFEVLGVNRLVSPTACGTESRLKTMLQELSFHSTRCMRRRALRLARNIQPIVSNRSIQKVALWCPRRIQHSRAHECALLSWYLAFLHDTTCSCCAGSKLTARARGWQNTVSAPGIVTKLHLEFAQNSCSSRTFQIMDVNSVLLSMHTYA